MATTKIWPVRDNLARVLDYAENHLKTANPAAYSPQEIKDLREVLEYAANDRKTARQFYVTGVNCIGDIAYEQMTATKQQAQDVRLIHKQDMAAQLPVPPPIYLLARQGKPC
jgi:hypothetical protein